MSTIKGSSLRIGGLNSGLDTEAIVNAMSASTKLRITTNQRKVLKLQAQQEAYRSIIDKFNKFKDKYFDILNTDTFLRSRTTFNRHSAKVFNSAGVEATPPGIRVTTSGNATPGNYNIEVLGVAKQASMTSNRTDAASSVFNPDDYADGQRYSMTVTVGGTSRQISFTGGDDVVDSINTALRTAFGASNNPAVGLVRVEQDGDDLRLISSDKRAISTSTPTALNPDIKFTFGGFETGSNNVTLVIDGQSRTVNFQTVSNDYFTESVGKEGGSHYGGLLDYVIVNDKGEFELDLETLKAPVRADFSTQAAFDDAVKIHQEKAAEQTELRRRFGVFRDVVNDMAFNAWVEGQSGDGHNPDFRSTPFNADERATALGIQGTVFDGINRTDFAAGDAGDAAFEAAKMKAVNDYINSADRAKEALEDLGFDIDFTGLTTEAAKTKAINDFINSADRAREALGLDPDFFDGLTTEAAKTKAINDHIASLSTAAARTAANNTIRDYRQGLNNEIRGYRQELTDNINEAHLAKIKSEMSDEQVALFEADVKRRNEATNQSVYDRAVADAWNKFNSWQRTTMSSGNVNALTMAEWNQIVGITTDAPSGDWKDIMPSATEMHDKVKAMFNEKIDALDVDDEHYARDLADLTSARDFWDGKDFSGGVAVSVEELEKGQVRAANGQVDEFMFIRGAYSERAALAASTQHFQDFRADILKKIEDGDFVSEDFANHFNDSSIQNSLGSITFADGTKVNAEISGGIVTLTAENKDGDPVDLGAYFNEGSVNGFGFTENITTANTISTSTRLSELKGVTADANGNFNMEINGAKFSFAGTTTISQMMTLVNSNAAAGVNLTFSTLTNTFELKTKEFGTGADIKLGDTAQGTLLNALGFDGVDLVAGENMRLQINGPSGQTVETASNSYDLNGTIITVGDNVVEGTTFDIIVEKDSSQLMNLIKDFVKDYNELIDFVFGFVNEKPDSAYYFLTDADRDELNLTEIQDKRWEDKAKQGLLYNDRTLINLMSSMRTALYSGVSRGDGTMFGLFSMGITTSSNWRQNGKLVIDEKKLEDAITNNVEMVTELFTQAEKGLMPQIDRILQSALNTTGARHDKGLLIQRAGLANTSSDRDNSIFDQIKRLNDIIGNLELRYQKQQDRYWKIFSALEKQMGTLNGQSDYIGQMLGSFGANNR